MGTEASYVLGGVAIGVGATLVMDLWNLFLRRAFGIPSLDYCLLGRWLRHMPEGTFVHASITTATRKPLECAVGWLAHYSIGVVFPFFVMQPALGLGIAASRTPKPAQARLKSLVTHSVFGVGLYVCARGVSSVL